MAELVCRNADLIPRVTECTRKSIVFIECIKTDSQCNCLRIDLAMKVCCAECYSVVELSLCGNNGTLHISINLISFSFEISGSCSLHMLSFH